MPSRPSFLTPAFFLSLVAGSWYNRYKPSLTGSSCESGESEEGRIAVSARERNVRYYYAHLDENRARGREGAQRRYPAHAVKLRARSQAYRDAHKVELKAKAQAYRDAHRAELNAKARARYHSQDEESRQRHVEYVLAHPEWARMGSSRRRARQQGLPSTLTHEQWKAIKAAYRFRCCYCGEKPKVLSQDHVIPVTKGGGTTADNIVPACRRCNSTKRAGPPLVMPALRLMF